MSAISLMPKLIDALHRLVLFDAFHRLVLLHSDADFFVVSFTIANNLY